MNAALYDRFSVVAFAPEAVREEVYQLRQRLPPSGRPILPAHVTIKGTFVEPADLPRIAATIRRHCAGAGTGWVRTHQACVLWGDAAAGADWAAIALAAEAADSLGALKWALVEALQGLCVTTYDGETGGRRRFTPHLTLVQQVPRARVEDALAVVHQAGLAYAWEVTEVTLVGRRDGSVWESLATYPLAGEGTGEVPSAPPSPAAV